MRFGGGSGSGPVADIPGNRAGGSRKDTFLPSVSEPGRLRRTRESGQRRASRFGCVWFTPATPKSGGTLKSANPPTRLTHYGSPTSRNVHSIRSWASTAIKLGLNRCANRLRSRGVLDRLEPDEGKLSRPVLRGGGTRKGVSLPDHIFSGLASIKRTEKLVHLVSGFGVQSQREKDNLGRYGSADGC